MPKIIENAKEKILEVTKEELKNHSYDDLSIREIAKKSGLGVGTIYNYYPNKVSLVAALMLSEWTSSISLFNEKLEGISSLSNGLEEIHSLISSFWLSNRVFLQSAEVKEYSSFQKKGHMMIISQIKEMIISVYRRVGKRIEELELTLLSHLLLDSALDQDFGIEDILVVTNKLSN
jgi:AcrR family transcriptional regulator